MHIHKWALVMALATFTSTLACGDEDQDSAGDGGGDGGAAAGDCSDPSVNAFADTCVETFLADCFDPAGECDGTIDLSTGETSLTWANGASVETTVGTGMPPAVNTTITSSSGTVCATGVSSNGTGGCASQTVYTRASDGAQQTWCIQADSSMVVSCPGGETVNVTAAQAQSSNSCGFAGGGEPCTMSY